MSTLEKERLSVFSNLRACLISTKEGIRTSHLNNDYQQMVGESIPFQRLGHKTLEDFLRTVPDISIKTKGGESFVEAKASETSAHITDLVREQRRTSKKKKKFLRNRPVIHIRENKPPRYRRRTAPATTAPPKRPPLKVKVDFHDTFGANRNVITYENNNIEEINRNANKIGDNLSKYAKPWSSPVYKTNSETQPNYQNNSDILEIITSSSSSSSNMSPVNTSPPVKSDAPSFTHKQNPRLQKSHPSGNESFLASNEVSKGESKLSNRLKQAKKVPPPINTSVPSDKNFSSLPDQPSKSPPVVSPSVKKGGPPPKVSKQTAQSRLEKAKVPLADQKLRVVVVHQQGEMESYFQNQLSMYIAQNRWGQEPSYVVYKQKSGKHQICFASTVRITIPRTSIGLPEEVIECSTFPNDFSDPTEAKENAAKLALEKLQEREQLSNAPVLRDSLAIINFVEQSVEKKDNGIWAHKFEDEFKLLHKQLLPEYWLEIIKASEKFDVEQLGPSSIIRRKNDPSHFGISKLRMPQLSYPAGNTWDVFITGGTSVNDVWLRFIGDEYSTRFDNFSSRMEKWYENKDNLKHPILVIGEYYAAYFDNVWWRVVITKIEVDKIRVKFIDHGDEEDLPRSVLYQLEPQFFEVPPQTTSVSLKGLKEFSERKDAEEFFLKTITARSLVAVVEECNQNNVSLVLYDTSHEEAVNLNDELRKLFELDYEKPVSLEIGSVYEMFVCHIDQDGIVYVQIVTDTYILLQDLLELVEDNVYESLNDFSELDTDKIYFVYKDDNYVRAKLRNSHFVDGKVEISLIDYGTSDHVFLEDITGLDEISYLLGHIPGQAVPVLLHEISPTAMTPEVRERILQMTCGADPPPVIVGRVRSVKDGLPVVELFMRTPENLLASINQTLVLETGLDITGLCHKIEDMSFQQPAKPKKSQDLITKALSNYSAGSIERILGDNRPQLPDINDDFLIYVHDTASPSHFLINPQDYVASLNILMDEMNLFYNKNKFRSNISEGDFCAAKDGNFWYRVYIDRILDRDNVSVKVLDYGCLKIIPTSNVKPLSDVFMRLPYIGYCAKIHGISPIHGDWSVEDCIALKNLINKKTLKAKLKDIIVNRSSLNGITLCLQLFTTDSTTGLEYDVAKQLVKQSHAMFV